MPVLPEIHPDIRKAHTLPGDFYLDSSIFDQQKKAIFTPSWQLIGHQEMVSESMLVHPVKLLDPYLGEPLLLSRDKHGVVRCLSNVCTHRGYLVATEPGRVRLLRCGYHGRCFGLDGQFRSMPDFELVEGFPSDCDHLKTLPLESFAGMFFTSLSLSKPFAEVYQPIIDRISFLPLDHLFLDKETSVDYEFPANWMLYCDNYLEGFHIPYVHPSLDAAIEGDSYSYELFDDVSVQVGLAREGEDSFTLPNGHPDYGKAVYAYYLFIFPNIMFNVYPWGISVNVVEPIEVNKTRVRFLHFKFPGVDDEQVGDRLHETEMEDEAVVLGVQEGIRSRFYDRGRYSPTKEVAVHHFHRLIIERMSRLG